MALLMANALYLAVVCNSHTQPGWPWHCWCGSQYKGKLSDANGAHELCRKQFSMPVGRLWVARLLRKVLAAFRQSTLFSPATLVLHKSRNYTCTAWNRIEAFSKCSTIATLSMRGCHWDWGSTVSMALSTAQIRAPFVMCLRNFVKHGFAAQATVEDTIACLLGEMLRRCFRTCSSSSR